MSAMVARSALASIGYRATAAAVLFVGLREASLTLPVEAVAAYVLFTYLPVIVGVLDLGGSMALISPATRALALERKRLASWLLGVAGRRAALGFLVGACALAAAAASGAWPWLDRGTVFATVMVAALLLLQAMTASMAQARFRYARFCLFGMAGNLVALVALVSGLPAMLQAGWLGYGLVTLLPPLVATALISRWYFSLEPAPDDAKAPDGAGEERGTLHRTATVYFVLQLAGVMLAALDLALLKLFGHAQQAALLGAVLRGLQIFSTPLLLLANQLWPLYARLGARGDTSGSRTVLWRSMGGAFVVAACAAPLVVFQGFELFALLYPPLRELPPGTWSLALGSTAAAYLASTLVVASFAAFLNGIGLVKPQLLASILFILAVVPAKLWLAADARIAWMLAATALLLPVANLVVLHPSFRRPLRDALGYH